MICFCLLKASYRNVCLYQPNFTTTSNCILPYDNASAYMSPLSSSCLNILRVSRQIKQEAAGVLYREGVFNIYAGWSRSTSALLNQGFFDLVQNVNLYIVGLIPPREEQIALLGEHMRKLNNTPTTRETFKVSIPSGRMRASDWQMVARGLEGLKRFRTVIIDATHNWSMAPETKYHIMGALLMPRSVRDTLETELGASTLESRSGRPCLVFYPRGKPRSGSALPSPERKGEMGQTTS